MLSQKMIELKRHLLEDAALVEDMISKSIRGLADKNEVMLLEVMNTEEPKANDYDREIDEMCVGLIAQYEPVARDLRMVIMIVKMNKDLERIADHAVNVCESALFLISKPVLPLDDLQLMGENAVLMLKDSINAFVNEDVQAAQAVLERDNIVDNAGDHILKNLTELMRAQKEAIPRALHVMRIAHNLERIADLATNIAEEVIYIVEGRDIKHNHAEG
ncbi:MAG: phosphate signaling complex protein PhoU [Candidatus Omnitrophica bacterium]|nr:phosphate signaling complex protein PhoU [Candidatus Omnitrophota bacterium]